MAPPRRKFPRLPREAPEYRDWLQHQPMIPDTDDLIANHRKQLSRLARRLRALGKSNSTVRNAIKTAGP